MGIGYFSTGFIATAGTQYDVIVRRRATPSGNEAKRRGFMRDQTRIPCVLMRGGTSKGTYFLAEDLPRDAETRDKVLLAVMGSPEPR